MVLPLDLTMQNGGVLKISKRYVHSSSDNVESFAEIGPGIERQLNKASLMLTNLAFRICVKVKRKVTKLVRTV